MREHSDRLLPLPALGMLLLTLGLIVAPHLLRLPIWASVLIVACGLWRLHIARRAEALPATWLRSLIAIGAAVGIYASYGTLLGRDAGTSLLIVMAALKLLEMRRRRDLNVVLTLGFFLIITQFLFSQALWTVPYLLLCVWAMTTLLTSLHQAGEERRPWRHLRPAGLMLLQALPVTLLLFVLFPRIAGPLWGMPDDSHGVTGLSDTMSPGTISQLSQSDAVAFRVSFEGEAPAPKLRYWRGPVLTAYDGRTWSRGARIDTPVQLETVGEALHYTVILQPHDQRWLFALDAPVNIPTDATLNPELELLRKHPLRELLLYEASSVGRYRIDAQRPGALPQRYLQLPARSHPRARALAESWRAETGDPAALLARAESFFRDLPFVYTLTPPALPRDPVDQFLFDTRKGFCEHYAGALAVLMRAAGVPARVVTGYQGGKINPIDGQLTIRQSDAHAWTEVWLQGEGWQRVDPTGWISPLRVERGLGGSVAPSDPVPMMARLEESWLKDLRLRWDALDHGWNRWVLAYGPELQRQLLSRIGLGDWPRMAGALAGSLALVLALIAAGMLLRGRARTPDPLQRLYLEFCARLARRGLPRRPHEGPRDYAARVVAARPELAAAVGEIIDRYVALRYAGTDSPDERKRLRERVRRFRP